MMNIIEFGNNLKCKNNKFPPLHSSHPHVFTANALLYFNDGMTEACQAERIKTCNVTSKHLHFLIHEIGGYICNECTPFII